MGEPGAELAARPDPPETSPHRRDKRDGQSASRGSGGRVLALCCSAPLCAAIWYAGLSRPFPSRAAPSRPFMSRPICIACCPKLW